MDLTKRHTRAFTRLLRSDIGSTQVLRSLYSRRSLRFAKDFKSSVALAGSGYKPNVQLGVKLKITEVPATTYQIASASHRRIAS